MTIKHLVISGGGSIGIKFLGVLQELNKKEFWQIEDIESVYATSVGCILAVFICLKYDWQTINDYIIKRPWKDIFKLSGKQIIEAYYNKGLYDKKIIEILFKPLLEAKDLSLSITLAEFYVYSKIHIHIFTFELNQFQTIELTHETNPNILLIDAITMSCAIPGLFMPICNDNKCYIDGGVMANYPLSFCLRDHINKEEIFGLNYCIHKPETCDSDTNVIINNTHLITKDSSILDFILGFSINAMNFITNNTETETIPYEIVDKIEDSPMTLNLIKNVIYSMERREKLIHEGAQVAHVFLENAK